MNATLTEALENAGTTTLSRPGSDGGLQSRGASPEEVRQYEEATGLLEDPANPRPYAGPYTDPEDPRNFWIARQDADAAEPVTSEQSQSEEHEHRRNRNRRSE